jgi:DNA modification methylase
VYYDKNGITLHNGDCLDVLATMPPESVDSIVTDPPYGLSFMGKKWDYDAPAVAIWEQCLRVLKPGGHLLAFAGTRTQHRMAVRIEDAGFEIRDMIAWVYGSGFPKSLDVSKAIDKRGGSVAGFEQFRDAVRAAMKRSGVSRSQLQAALGNHMLSHYLSAGSQPAVPNLRDYRIIRDTVRLGSEFDVLFADEAEREVVGQDTKARSTSGKSALPTVGGSTVYESWDITAPATPAAQQWAGWGTALKPALEPITVARKPLVGTVAANVLQHGTGAVNVDGCKVDGERLPANFIHDGSEEACDLLGDAARFFYCAKAGPDERRDSKHPTVKPVALMRYLVRLVTPIGATVLDPFCGSGTTLEAAMLESCKAIGVELNPEYCADAVERLRQGVLF